MALNDSTRKPKKDRTDAPDPDLVAHSTSLGLNNVEEYVAWCVRRGFSRRTDKHWRAPLKERSYAHRAIADARLARRKQENRRPEKVIERIFNGELDASGITAPHLKAVYRACKSAQESRQTRVAFHELLQHIGV